MLLKIYGIMYLLESLQTLAISDLASPLVPVSERPKLETEPDSRQSTSDSSASSKAIQPSSSKRRVVVFDIDDAICKSTSYLKDEEVDSIKKNDLECPFIEYQSHYHVFLPYLQILFEYLFERGVRIAFFSAGDKGRNLVVIPQLLIGLFGRQKYESLKSKGQFDIFSLENAREGNRSSGSEGNYVKDLRAVIRDVELLSDAVLVEDDFSYVAVDQQPCLLTPCLFHWKITEPRNITSWNWHFKFSKNSIYYMLGVFKTYFEHEKYEQLPFREGLGQILPQGEKYYDDFFLEDPFVCNMIDIGLAEVQKQVPNATFFGMRDFNSSSTSESLGF